jgi:hypothetical protein
VTSSAHAERTLLLNAHRTVRDVLSDEIDGDVWTITLDAAGAATLLDRPGPRKLTARWRHVRRHPDVAAAGQRRALLRGL